VPIVAITFIAIRERPIRSRTPVLKSVVALTLLPGPKAAAIAAALTLGVICRPVAKWLRSVWRYAWLRLKALLRLLVSVLSLGRRSEAIRQPAEIAVVFQVVISLSRRSLLTALCERLGGLGGCNKPEVMFGMLQIILRRDRISSCMSVSRELEVFLGDMMRIAAYFDIRSIRFVGPRQRIGSAPIVRRPTAHPFVLTWSHFNFPTSIRLSRSSSDRFRQAFSSLAQEGWFTPSRHSNELISSHPRHGHERSH
jgi:hypothetical protein